MSYIRDRKMTPKEKTEITQKLMKDIASGNRYSCPNCGEEWPMFTFLGEDIQEDPNTNDLYAEFHCGICFISLCVTYKPWKVDFYPE